MKKNLASKVLVSSIMVLSAFSAVFLIYSYDFFQDLFHSFSDAPTSVLIANGVPFFQDLLRFDFAVPLGVIIMLAAPIIIGITAYRMGKEKEKM
ncbi:MAG: hypothetical protein ACLTBZ_09590 [Faecalispora jeddahensis]|jgi:hypothetical protein|uniref:hypothetical protein n=1 Tax=Faecalispora jeddahensis TaxID=1414721 RepID=UPI0025807FE4|nr:hypothetical protein [Clostridium sp.]